MESQIVITALKRVLKSKGLNYGDLANMLGISRDSIKRIFSQGTLTLDRLIKICNFLGMNFQDLSLLMDVEYEANEYFFSLEQESFFAENFNYLFFYQLIFKYDSVKDLAKDYDLNDQTIVKILSKLDEFELVEWLPGNEVKILGHRKFASTDGPVSKKHSKRLSLRLIEESVKNEKDENFLFFLTLSERASQKYNAKFKVMKDEIRKEMEIERILNIPGDLYGVFLHLSPSDFIQDELKGFKA